VVVSILRQAQNWEALIMLSLKVTGKMYCVDVEQETPPPA